MKGGHIRSISNNIFKTVDAPEPVFTFPRGKEPFNRTRAKLLAEKLQQSGANNYGSRRLLEMYNNKSVLKAADLFPAHIDTHLARELGREIQLPQGKFNKKIAENMADLLEQINRRDNVLSPSAVSNTGWREMTKEKFE